MDMRLSTFRRVIWVLVGAALLTFVALQWVTSGQGEKGEEAAETAFRAAFELTDHQGIVRTEKDYQGRWMLMFFGFANCPDICPTTLAEVAAVMKSLGDQSSDVQPIFISIDPERDTPEALAEFMPLFGASIVGLTGTPDQIASTAETFPIFYEKIEEASAPDGYTMSHTSHLLLFDPQAGFADSWPYGTSAEEILADLKARL